MLHFGAGRCCTDTPGCGTPLCHAFPDSPIPTVPRGCVLRRPARSHLPPWCQGQRAQGGGAAGPQPAHLGKLGAALMSSPLQEPRLGSLLHGARQEGLSSPWGRVWFSFPRTPGGVVQPPGAGTLLNSTLQEGKTWGRPCRDVSGHPPPPPPRPPEQCSRHSRAVGVPAASSAPPQPPPLLGASWQVTMRGLCLWPMMLPMIYRSFYSSCKEAVNYRRGIN